MHQAPNSARGASSNNQPSHRGWSFCQPVWASSFFCPVPQRLIKSVHVMPMIRFKYRFYSGRSSFVLLSCLRTQHPQRAASLLELGTSSLPAAASALASLAQGAPECCGHAHISARRAVSWGEWAAGTFPSQRATWLSGCERARVGKTAL